MDGGVGHARLRGLRGWAALSRLCACSDGVSDVVACLGATPAEPWATAAAPWCSLPCKGWVLASNAAKPAARQWRAGVPRPLWGIGLVV